MNPKSSAGVPVAQLWMRAFFSATQRILHIEAVSGAVLIAAASLALVLANSPAAASYHDFWSTHLSMGIGRLSISQPLQFWVNDVLMTLFFLVVGMEIRSEIHNGALSTLRTAALPLAAALGGVVVPAVLYLSLNSSGELSQGWAVPTATDIAFAVGVLALLGRSIPSNLRILLLAVAIIDDIVAVLIIAFFYSGGLNVSGVPWALGGILFVLGMQRLGFSSAYLYFLPGGMVWFGLLKIGAHPTLAGVILGLMTPVMTKPLQAPASTVLKHETAFLVGSADSLKLSQQDVASSLTKMREAQRELLPPVSRVQMALHPWVAFIVMPVFALANAGVTIGGVDLSVIGAQSVMLGVFLALVLGKPVGIFLFCQIAVRVGLCQLPSGVSWAGVVLVGLFAGIGFTMSIFIGNLAFTDTNLLNASKLGVLMASLTAAVVGLVWGVLLRKRLDHS